MALSRWAKICITITIIALMIYDLRWLYGVYGRFQLLFSSPENLANHPLWRIIIDYVLTGIIGNGLRLVATILALVAIYKAWGPKHKPFIEGKKTVAQALLFEGIYWLSIFPISIIELISIGRAPYLMTAFVLQTLLAGIPLVILAAKVWQYTEAKARNVVIWAGTASIGYLIGIWFNSVFRWFSMAQSQGIGFLLTGITSLGFLGAAVPLTLAVILAVVAFYLMFKKQNAKKAIILAGVGLILLSLYFILYIIYSVLTNMVNYIILVEIWPLPVIALGIGMLRGKI